jgi:hypothetical protein
MSAQMTPGTWSSHPDRTPTGRRAIVADGQFVLAEFFPDIRHAGERADAECAANARLCAAAKHLLAALTALHANMLAQDLENDAERPTEDQFQQCMRDAAAAIANAQGGAE